MSKEQTPTSYLHWEEFLKLCRNLERDQRWKYYLFVNLSTYLALRVSDVKILTWDDMLTGKGQVRDKMIIREKKTGKARVVYINDNLKKAIEKARDNMPVVDRALPIFTSRAGKKTPLTTQNINRMLKVFFHEYNIKYEGNVSSHLFRKTYGRRFIEKSEYKEKALILLMDVFSHSALHITKRYLGIRQEEIKEVYNTVI